MWALPIIAWTMELFINEFRPFDCASDVVDSVVETFPRMNNSKKIRAAAIRPLLE